MEKANKRVYELENTISANQDPLAPEGDEGVGSFEGIEESKNEGSADSLSQLAERFHCDINNPDEIRSLQLAMQLEAQEKEDHIQKLIQVQQQELVLKGIVNDPQSVDRVNPDSMTYEQLLELEEKMGKVSQGLSQVQISVYL